MRKRTLTAHSTLPGTRVLVSVDEAATLLSLGRTVVYRLVRRGELRSIKVGRTRRVVAASLNEYIARLLERAHVMEEWDDGVTTWQ
jgi:excisionase family DNA binding protein